MVFNYEIRRIKKNSNKEINVYLSGDNIRDVSFMKDNTNVVFLSAMYNEISNLEPLEGNKTLRELYLQNNKIWDLTPLKFSCLVQISLRNNRIDDVAPLSFIQTLTAIDVSSNRVQDVSLLAKLRNLKFLDVSNNLIDDISSISQTPSITSLCVSHNYITDVSYLLTSTTILHSSISGNPVVDITSKMDILQNVCKYNKINERNLRITLFDLLSRMLL